MTGRCPTTSKKPRRPCKLNGYVPASRSRSWSSLCSNHRGLLFYRLLQQAVATDPHPYRELVGGTETEVTTRRDVFDRDRHVPFTGRKLDRVDPSYKH